VREFGRIGNVFCGSGFFCGCLDVLGNIRICRRHPNGVGCNVRRMVGRR
jgi:hypothetical protein